MIELLLKERNLPSFRSRGEMLEMLFREEYGYMPPKPQRLSWKEVSAANENFCAGKATMKKMELTAEWDEASFSFPVYVTVPTGVGKFPFFIHINFRDCVPDRIMPTEEIVDNGFAVLSFCYKDVTSDNGDFTNGLAGVLYPNGERDDTSAGKIAMWAWAAQRVMDYAETLDCLDLSRSVVCGHSRLGKTALLTAATDERFAFVHSNDSGCSGASLSRGRNAEGETVDIITQRFPFWFCKNYLRYAQNENEMPFDQHWLLASIAPRYVYVSDAEDDLWADPVSSYLNCCAVSEVYQGMGKVGFVHEDRFPQTGELLHEGTVGYHIRRGRHYYSREDWQGIMRFVKKHSDDGIG